MATIGTLVQRAMAAHRALTEPIAVRFGGAATPPVAYDPHALASAVCGQLPADLEELWATVGSLRVFADIDYGQWGLAFVDPARAASLTTLFRTTRPDDWRSGDLVIAEFLGDGELAVIRSDPGADDYGRVYIALPIDPRKEWPCVGTSLAQFLERFLESGGEKFWE